MNPPAKSCCDARLFASPADLGSHVLLNHGKEAYAAFVAAGEEENQAPPSPTYVLGQHAVARAVGAEALMEGAANTNASASARADERPMEMQAVDEALDGFNHAMRGVGKASEVLRDALDGAFRACYRDNAHKLAAVCAAAVSAAANMDFTATDAAQGKKRREGEGKVELQDAEKKIKDCAYWEDFYAEPPMSAEEKAADEADEAKWDELERSFKAARGVQGPEEEEDQEEDQETMEMQAAGKVIKDKAYWENFYENPPMSAEEKAADEAHKASWKALEERVEASKKEDKRLEATKKEDQEVAEEEDEETMEMQTSGKVIKDNQAYYAPPPISAEEKAAEKELKASWNARGAEEAEEDDEEESEEDDEEGEEEDEDEGEFSAKQE